jgi:hypothetical protein
MGECSEKELDRDSFFSRGGAALHTALGRRLSVKEKNLPKYNFCLLFDLLHACNEYEPSSREGMC